MHQRIGGSRSICHVVSGNLNLISSINSLIQIAEKFPYICLILLEGGDHPLNYQRKRAWRFPIVGMGCDKFNYIITSMPIVWFFQECRIVLDCTRVTHSRPSLKLLFSGINYNRNDGIRTSTELQLALK